MLLLAIVAIPELLNNLDGGELVCLSKSPIIAIQGVPRQREQDQYQVKAAAIFIFTLHKPCLKAEASRQRNLRIYGDVTLDRYCVSARNKLEKYRKLLVVRCFQGRCYRLFTRGNTIENT